MNIFRTKNVSLDKTEMHRHLKLWDLILLGIGAMVGTGVFTITGTAAATLAGPALVISIVISALCVGLSALFFAEFASRVPATGGAYSYLYCYFRRIPSLVGWLVNHDGIHDSHIWCGFGLGSLFLKACFLNMG